MRKTLKLAKREYKAAVRTKGFLIGLIVAPILMGGSGIVMAIFNDKVDTDDKTVAVVDHSGVVAEALVEMAGQRNAEVVLDSETGEKVQPAYSVKVVPPDPIDRAQQRLALSDQVRNDEIHAFLEIGADALYPGEDTERNRIAYYAENAVLDRMRSWLNQAVNNHLRRVRMAERGVEPEVMESILFWRDVEGLGLVTLDDSGAIQDAKQSSEGVSIGIPIIMAMLLFMMIMMGAMPLLSSVMEEKNQRIAEVLLGSVKPFQFMMGKVLGGLGVAVTASTVYLIGGAIAVQRFGWAEYVPYDVLPWFCAYVLLAITMLGATFASLGSACNDAKDAQSLMMPAMFPIMIPMFMMIPVLERPLSGFATVMSLIPPLTPMMMLLRQSSPVELPAWQPWAGLVGVVLYTVLCVWAGGRIFRVGILMQGATPKLGNILKWAVKG